MDGSRRPRIYVTPCACKRCLRSFKFGCSLRFHEEDCSVVLPSFSNVIFSNSSRDVERSYGDPGSDSSDEEDKKIESEVQREVRDTESELSVTEDMEEMDLLQDPSIQICKRYLSSHKYINIFLYIINIFIVDIGIHLPRTSPVC